MDVCHLVVNFGYLLLHAHSSFPNHSLSHTTLLLVLPFSHDPLTPSFHYRRIESIRLSFQNLSYFLPISYIPTTYSHYFLKSQITQRPKFGVTGLTSILNFFSIQKNLLNFQTVLKLTIS